MAPKGVGATPVDLTQIRADILQAMSDPMSGADLLATFHRWWYSRPYTWPMTSFLGVRMMKNPLDLWVVQEMIHHTKPTLLIETGTAWGGSALFYAHAMDAVGVGRVLSIDIDDEAELPRHKRIQYLRGRSSTALGVLAAVQRTVQPSDRVMVILDSDHRAAHVLEELQAYAPLVTPGSFLIVEDTNVNGHPVEWDGGAGPLEALQQYLAGAPAGVRFEREPLAERYLLTMYPGGWLRRV